MRTGIAGISKFLLKATDLVKFKLALLETIDN